MFSVEVAQALSKGGYDVVRASDTGFARADDREILQKAISENRILITLDEHFGDWVILFGSKARGDASPDKDPGRSINKAFELRQRGDYR